MTDRTLRSFDSALREVLPGGEDDRLGRLDGDDDDWALVGVVVRSAEPPEEEDDGTTSAHSDAASE